MNQQAQTKKTGVASVGTIYLDINCTEFPFSDGLFAHKETTGEGYQLEPGGSAFNFARLCKQLGVDSSFIGTIGQDSTGTLLKQAVLDSGVTPYLSENAEVQTNIAVHYVRSDGVSIMTSVGSANQSLTTETVLTHLPSVLSKTQFLYFGGCYKLKKLLPAYKQFATLAHKAETRTVLDHGRVNNTVTSKDIAQIKQLLPHIDYYLPSRDEFLATWEATSIQEGCKKVAKISSAVCIIKDSNNGVSIFNQGILATIPAFKVLPVNTVGAGDSFNAGFLAGLLQGQSIEESAVYANAVAAIKISLPGPLSLDRINELLNSR